MSFVLYHLNLFVSCTVVSLNRKLKAVYAQSCHCFFVCFLFACFVYFMAFPEIWASLVAQMVKNLCGRPGLDPWVRKIPWRRKWQSSPLSLPGKSHEQRSLAGYSPWDHRESDTTEWLIYTFPERGKKINNCIYNYLIRQKGPQSIIMSFILIFFNGIFLLHILIIFVLIQVA